MSLINIFSILLILSILNYVNNQITPYTYFKAIPKENNLILLVTGYQILFLNQDFTLNKEIYSFEIPSIPDREFLETVYIQNYFIDNNETFFLKMSTSYSTINPSLNLKHNYTVKTVDFIFPYECYYSNTSIDCTALGIYLNAQDDLICTEAYKLTETKEASCTEKGYDFLNGNSEITDKYSKNVECNLMKKNSSEVYLVCFYEIISLELVASSFRTASTLQQFPSKISHKYMKNNGLDYIKTIISPYSENIALISYIEANSSNLYCLLFNITEDTFSEPKNMMSNCRNILVDFGIVKNTKNIEEKQYLVYCQVNDSTMQYILFNESLVESEQQLKIYFYELEDCIELYSTSVLFIEKDEYYYIMYSCKNGNNENITKQECLISSTNETIDDSIDNITNTTNNNNTDNSTINNSTNTTNTTNTTDATNTTNTTDTTNTTNTTNTTDISNTTDTTNTTNTTNTTDTTNTTNTTNTTDTTDDKIDKTNKTDSTNITNTTNTTDTKNTTDTDKNKINQTIIIEYDGNDNTTIKGSTSLKKEELEENIEEVINVIEIGKNYEIKGEDYEMKIHPIDTDLGENKTNVDFSECESILRKKYNISDDQILTTLQIEIQSKLENSLTNKVEYAVYDENKNKLDLSCCDKITVNYGIKNTSLLDENLISTFSKIGVDILNIGDNFFNDICFPYNVNDTDVTLGDRQTDIYQNYSICDTNCTYDNINFTSNLISCTCGVKSNISVEEENPNFGEIIESTFKDSNFEIIYCYNILLDDITSNKGFLIFGVLLIGHILLFTYYFLSGINSVNDFIQNEMKKYNYISKIDTEKKPKKVSNPIKKKKAKKCNSISKKMKTKEKTKMIDSANSNLFISSGPENSLKKMHKPILAISDQAYISKKKKKSKKKSIKPSTKKIDIVSSRHNEIKKFEEEKFPGYYNLILIDLNQKKPKLPPESKFILNYYSYKQALKHDVRDFWRIVFICMLHRQSVLHTFFFKSALEPQSLRICLFVFHYSCDFFLNALFYSTTKISDRYNYEGEYLYFYSLVNNLIISFVSTVTSFFLRMVLKFLINSKKKTENIFREQEKIMYKNKKAELPIAKRKEIVKSIKDIISCLKIKITIFIIIEFSLMLFFTYYITVFCAVYKQTQVSWISDSVVSLLMSNLLDSLIAFGVAGFYTISLRTQMECIYNIVIFIYDFGH